MDIFGARAFLITQLQTLLGDKVLTKEVQEHRGQFASLEEIKTIAARSPAVRVAFRGLQNIERSGPELLADVLWAVHVLAGDTRASARNNVAGAVAIAIVDHVAGEAAHWTFAEDAPRGLTAVDLTTLPIDQNGVSLWQLTWSQRCRLQVIDPLGALTDFDGFDTDHFKPGADTVNDQPPAQTTDDYLE